MRRLPRLGAVIAAGLATSCGAALQRLPAGPGQADPDAASVFAQATISCRAVASLSAELRVSGTAAGQRLRGRVLAGLAHRGERKVEERHHRRDLGPGRRGEDRDRHDGGEGHCPQQERLAEHARLRNRLGRHGAFPSCARTEDSAATREELLRCAVTTPARRP